MRGSQASALPRDFWKISKLKGEISEVEETSTTEYRILNYCTVLHLHKTCNICYINFLVECKMNNMEMKKSLYIFTASHMMLITNEPMEQVR
jgi:hypothetical protein